MLRKIVCAAVIVLASYLPAAAQLPPLIDRELLFGDPEISGSRISPDGRFITFLKPFRGERNIWIKTRAESFAQARPITADTSRPVSNYFWSLDSRYVIYAQDRGGDENYRIYAVDPSVPGAPVPPSRDLTPLDKIRATIIDVPRATPGEILVGLNDRRPDLHDVYRLVLATGEKKLLWKNDQNVAAWVADTRGGLRLGVRQTNDGGTEILRVAGDSLVAIYAVNAEEECTPLRFTRDGSKFYLVTNKGASADKSRLELFDMNTGTTSLVEQDPEGEVDFADALFSDLTGELLATVYQGDRLRVYPRQEGFARDWERLQTLLPPGEFSFGSATLDERILLVSVSSDVDPGSRYLFDRAAGTVELLYRSRPDLPSADLARETPVRYTARDGLVIPAYLVLPRGVPDTNLPAVMLVHGGPWARNSWGYDPEAQFLANRGYAVLLPNFRGSTGYGKKFLNAGNKQWGRGFMQHDISDGVKYLVDRRIADPKRIGIYGGSYGGYATLAGLAFTPRLYAAGVSYVGPSNLLTLLAAIPPYWAPIKKMFDTRMGDLGNQKDREDLAAASPLNSAANIVAPLLVIQGANDPRVPRAESDRIVVALRDRGRPVEYLVAPDEGHGFAGRDNRLAVYTAMEKFFARHMGGRFQASVSPAVEKKLKLLTVDPATLTGGAAAGSDTAPPAAVLEPARIRPGTEHLTTSFTMQGKKMVMATTRTISAVTRKGRKAWRVADATTGAMGASTDTVDIDAATGLTLHRTARQAGGTLELDFTPGGIYGAMEMGGKEVPVEVHFPGPVVSDNAGIDVALCTLPLREGYRALLTMFDSSNWRVREMAIAVAGKERVTTPAGSYDALKVAVTPRDGGAGQQTYWITPGKLRIVRNDAEIPASMGGGIVTTELAK
ncbi:MAG TPA: alpha/beta fold hydrolase [Bacteroidota bacterium]|nr:alpha/beta fold hydrolase [Bacteroidota bacterium]